MQKSAGNLYDAWSDLTLQSGAASALPNGPLPSAVVKGGLGLGVGALLGNHMGSDADEEEKARLRRNWMLMGGLAGAATAVPDMITNKRLVDQGRVPGVKGTWDAINTPIGFKGTVLPRMEKANEYSTFGSLHGMPNMGSRIVAPSALDTILRDTTLDPVQKALGVTIINEAMDNKSNGLFSTTDLIRGAWGAGLGLGAGIVVGKTMGAFFSLPKKSQNILAGAGALGGLLKATGVWE